MINWKIENQDADLIKSIVERAKRGGFIDIANSTDCIMDITAVHLNGCPLRLTEMLQSPDLDFLHDFNGIRSYIDRDTGKLTNCFLPRFAA